MSVIYIVLPLALALAGAALCGFIWAARAGQFDDLDTPAVRAAFEDDAPTKPPGRGGRAAPQERPT